VKFPDRNVLAGGLVGVACWGITTALAARGIYIDPALQDALPLLVGFLIAHIVPRSAHEIVAELDDGIVHMAQADPDSNVSYVLPPAHVPPGEPAMIGGPPSVGGMATLSLPPPAMPATSPPDPPLLARAA
jgi:hypothetical protein